VNKLRTAAIGIGLAMTLAGCGGGGSEPAAAVATTTTLAKPIPKTELITAAKTLCDAKSSEFDDLRKAGKDLLDSEANRETVNDFMLGQAIPAWESAVGSLRVAGTPNRDPKLFARLNTTLDEALGRMKAENQADPVKALEDLVNGPDDALKLPTRAGETFANANELTTEFGFKSCEIF
jgi:hypothetical protein